MCERAETAGVDGIHETDNMIRVFKWMNVVEVVKELSMTSLWHWNTI